MGSLFEQPFSNGKPYSHAEVTTSQRWSFLVSTLERPNPSWVLADMASLPTLFLGDAHKDSADTVLNKRRLRLSRYCHYGQSEPPERNC
jgi:hypothetical protein